MPLPLGGEMSASTGLAISNAIVATLTELRKNRIVCFSVFPCAAAGAPYADASKVRLLMLGHRLIWTSAAVCAGKMSKAGWRRRRINRSLMPREGGQYVDPAHVFCRWARDAAYRAGWKPHLVLVARTANPQTRSRRQMAHRTGASSATSAVSGRSCRWPRRLRSSHRVA